MLRYTTLLSLVLTAGCACEGPAILPPLDGGAPPGDAGEGEGEGEADGGIVDAGPPPTPGEIARDLCRSLRSGLLNAGLQFTQGFPPSRCSPTDPIDDIAQLGVTLAPGDCTQVDELFRSLEAGLRDARFAVDTDQLAACVARGREIRETFAEQSQYDERQAALLGLLGDPACQGVVTPLVGPDEPCGHTLECPAGTACEADPLDSAILSCLAPALEGQRCEETALGDRLPIRSCGEGLVCVLNLCTRALVENLPCTGQVPCADGLVCATDQVCRPPGGDQAACDTSPQCESGFRCEANLCTAIDPLPLDGEVCASACAARCSVCRPGPDVDGGVVSTCAPPGDIGAACAINGHCRRGLHCDTGVCAARFLENEACTPNDCDDGLGCVATGLLDGGPTNICAPLAPLGAPCDDRPCADGFCTDGLCREGVAADPCGSDGACTDGHLCVTNVCTVSPREGAPCTSDARCDTGLTCIADRCRARPGPDEACFPGDVCNDRAFCVDGTCLAKGEPGEACAANGECLSGQCLDTLTCAAEGASCVSARDTFAYLLGLSLLLVPLRVRRRRARVSPRS